MVEFRHPSWWDGEVQRTLARQHVAFVGQSYPPPLELPDEVVANTDVIYYRFHGVPELYKSSYSPEFLSRVAGEVKAAENVRAVYLYFNNGIGAVGVENARQMQQLL